MKKRNNILYFGIKSVVVFILLSVVQLSTGVYDPLLIAIWAIGLAAISEWHTWVNR